ncbi:MAG: hypothetical protein K0Q53_2872 [Massilibacillus sp.]|nr:hypothetical protein [Massilibacillus sp.]
MAESEQAVRVILSFMNALCIIYITAKVIGEEKKAKWFKKRQKSNIFTRRGFLGDACNFGVPQKWQGFAVAFWLFGSIGVLSYVVIFTM